MHMDWWIISFLELTFLDHIFSTQIIISFLELTFLDHFFTQIGGSIWCFVLALCVTVTTRWIITCLHGWSGKLWIILLGSGGGDLWGR